MLKITHNLFCKNVKNHAIFVEGFWPEFYARGRFMKFSMSDNSSSSSRETYLFYLTFWRGVQNSGQIHGGPFGFLGSSQVLASLLPCSHAYFFACLHSYLLTCLLAYMLFCFIAYMLTCFLAYLLTCLLVYFLTCSLACLLSCLLVCLLAWLLAYLLSFLLPCSLTYLSYLLTCLLSLTCLLALLFSSC